MKTTDFFEEDDVRPEFDYLDEGATCRIITNFTATLNDEMVPVNALKQSDNIIFTGCLTPPKARGHSRGAMNAKQNIILREVEAWILDRDQLCVWLKSRTGAYYRLETPHPLYEPYYRNFNINVKIVLTLLDLLEQNPMWTRDEVEDDILSWPKVIKILKKNGLSEEQLLNAEPFINTYYHQIYPRDHPLLRPKGTFLTELQHRAQLDEPPATPEPEPKSKTKTIKRTQQVQFDEEDEIPKTKSKERVRELQFDEEDEMQIPKKKDNRKKDHEPKKKRKIIDDDIEPIPKKKKKLIVDDDDDVDDNDSVVNDEKAVEAAEEPVRAAIMFDHYYDSCKLCLEFEDKDMVQCRECFRYYCSTCCELEMRIRLETIPKKNWLCRSCDKPPR